MKFLVYFKRDNQGSILQDKHPVNLYNIELEMNAIEQKYKESYFRWTPSKEDQIRIIKEMAPDSYVDSFVHSWEFRQKLLEAQ